MAAGDLTRLKLSGSTDGKNIKVVATATLGTTIHTANGTDWDEVYLEACVISGTDRLLTIEWGEATSPDGLTTITIPSGVGWVPVVQGHLILNSLVVSAFGAAANEIMINGYVLRHGQ